jgi:plasmid stabilization system protein ParE
MELRFEPEATEELEEATAYYAEQSAGTGERFLSDMVLTRELLLQFPGAGPPIRGNFRRILLRVFPYQLIYRVEGEVVRICRCTSEKTARILAKATWTIAKRLRCCNGYLSS